MSSAESDDTTEQEYCRPTNHAGNERIQVTILDGEVRVERSCDKCEEVVEEWGYQNGVESVEINLPSGNKDVFGVDNE